MNRLEIIIAGTDLIRGMAPHIARRKTANILLKAVDELARKCNWTFDADDGHYQTSCSNGWSFEESGIRDNGVIYCPYCGGTVVET